MTQNVEHVQNDRRASAIELLDAATEWLATRNPDLDFSIYIDTEGSGVTLTTPERVQHLGDVRHPMNVATGIFQAARGAKKDYSDYDLDRAPVAIVALERSLAAVFSWLPDHIVWFGRDGGNVFAAFQHSDGSEQVRLHLDGFEHTLSDVVLSAAYSQLSELGGFTVAAARQAA